MKAEAYNRLSIKKKRRFIEQHLGNQPFGVFNTLIFPDKAIWFICALRTKECIYSDAMDIPEDFTSALSKILPDKECINIIHDSHAQVKERIFNALQREAHKTN